MIAELNTGDWAEVFHHAGRGEAHDDFPCSAKGSTVERAYPGEVEVGTDPFTRKDVKRVIALSEGENDERDWVIVGELCDGRFFAITAGCDYTGWG